MILWLLTAINRACPTATSSKSQGTQQALDAEQYGEGDPDCVCGATGEVHP